MARASGPLAAVTVRARAGSPGGEFSAVEAADARFMQGELDAAEASASALRAASR